MAEHNVMLYRIVCSKCGPGDIPNGSTEFTACCNKLKVQHKVAISCRLSFRLISKKHLLLLMRADLRMVILQGTLDNCSIRTLDSQCTLVSLDSQLQHAYTTSMLSCTATMALAGPPVQPAAAAIMASHPDEAPTFPLLCSDDSLLTASSEVPYEQRADTQPAAKGTTGRQLKRLKQRRPLI